MKLWSCSSKISYFSSYFLYKDLAWGLFSSAIWHYFAQKKLHWCELCNLQSKFGWIVDECCLMNGRAQLSQILDDNVHIWRNYGCTWSIELQIIIQNQMNKSNINYAIRMKVGWRLHCWRWYRNCVVHIITTSPKIFLNPPYLCELVSIGLLGSVTDRIAVRIAEAAHAQFWPHYLPQGRCYLCMQMNPESIDLQLAGCDPTKHFRVGGAGCLQRTSVLQVTEQFHIFKIHWAAWFFLNCAHCRVTDFFQRSMRAWSDPDVRCMSIYESRIVYCVSVV